MASTSAEGKAAYQQWVVQANRNIVHILEDIPSLKPSLDHLCEILPRLQCRYYSISSSPKVKNIPLVGLKRYSNLNDSNFFFLYLYNMIILICVVYLNT